MKYVLLMFPFGYISCPLKLVCNIISLSLPFETRAGRVRRKIMFNLLLLIDAMQIFFAILND